MRFIQSVMYSDKDNESYVETRVRLYRQQATKSFLSLPPPPPSPRSKFMRASYKKSSSSEFLVGEVYTNEY